MTRNLIKIATLIAVFAVVLSINAFAAVGDSVANVFLNKVATEATADYYGLEDYETYSKWAESVGYFGINLPECAVDGRYDDWGDYSRWVVKCESGGVFEVDLDGYYALETLDVYYVWGTHYGSSSASDETTIQVSVDGGKNWTTVIDKKPLDYSTSILALNSDMGIYKATFNMNGAVANKVRFIFEDADMGTNGFNLQEVQCSGKVAEKPEIPETPAPETFDGLSVAVAVMALGACGVVVAKKRR